MNICINYECYILIELKFLNELMLAKPLLCVSVLFVITQQTFVGLQNVFKTSSRRLHVLKTSSVRLQRNNFSSFRTSSRRLAKAMKTSSRRLEDISWRRLEDMSWKCLQNVLETNKMFTGAICIYQI